MNEHNERMAAMLAAQAPAARDAGFEIAVLTRIERRRFHRALAGRLAATLMAAALLALVMPALRPLWENGLAAGSRILPPVFANLALGIVLMVASLTLPLWRRAD